MPEDHPISDAPGGPAGTDPGPSAGYAGGPPPEDGPGASDPDARRDSPIDAPAARLHDPLTADERGSNYEASAAQKGAALVAAAGLVLLIAGTVMRLTAGRCIVPRTTALGTSCAGVVAEPWFGVLVLVTVGASAVGAVLGVRDLTSG